MQYTAQLITALVALGMALAFIVADRRSPTSRALSAFLAWVGISIATFVLILVPLRAAHGITIWDGFFAIPETFAFYYAYEWVLRVRRALRVPREHRVRRVLRVRRALQDRRPPTSVVSVD